MLVVRLVLGGMVTPIGAMSLSSRYETPRSRVLSLADEEEGEEGGGLMVAKNNLDVVNRKHRSRRGRSGLLERMKTKRD